MKSESQEQKNMKKLKKALWLNIIFLAAGIGFIFLGIMFQDAQMLLAGILFAAAGCVFLWQDIRFI
jgi:NhaP-type Na+/H+ or K+/H+ antiporter